MNGIQENLMFEFAQNAIVPTGTESKEIPLTRGMYTTVDADDYNYLSQWKWNACKGRNTYYAVRMYGREMIMMHRVILNTPSEMGVDHLYHNGLNNQRGNVRNCTNSQNTQNMIRSQYQGVSWNKNEQKYTSKIGFQRKRFHLGYFHDPIDAAKAYDRAAKNLFGEFCKTNFPTDL